MNASEILEKSTSQDAPSLITELDFQQLIYPNQSPKSSQSPENREIKQKRKEIIFKIIRERDVEIDSDDEDDDGIAGDWIRRRKDCDKEMYKSMFKKCRNLVKYCHDREIRSVSL